MTQFNFKPFMLKKDLKYVEHHITDHCNLNCNGCTHFSPLAKPWFEDIETFKKDFNKLNDMFNVKTIRLMGGEPLLHPDIKQFLVEARKIFRTARIELVTNGILLKDDLELVKVVNKNNIWINVSEYHILKNLNDYLKNIRNYILSSRTEMYNICLDLEGKQNPYYTYSTCISRAAGCNYYQNGKFYICAPVANIEKFNSYFNKNLPTCEGISIYEHTAEEILNYLYNTPAELCKYCNADQALMSYHPFCRSTKNINEWIYPPEEKK